MGLQIHHLSEPCSTSFSTFSLSITLLIVSGNIFVPSWGLTCYKTMDKEDIEQHGFSKNKHEPDTEITTCESKVKACIASVNITKLKNQYSDIAKEMKPEIATTSDQLQTPIGIVKVTTPDIILHQGCDEVNHCQHEPAPANKQRCFITNNIKTCCCFEDECNRMENIEVDANMIRKDPKAADKNPLVHIKDFEIGTNCPQTTVEWGEWGPCEEGFQTKVIQLIHESKDGTEPCIEKVSEEKPCSNSDDGDAETQEKTNKKEMDNEAFDKRETGNNIEGYGRF